MRRRCDRCGALRPADALHADAGLLICTRCFGEAIGHRRLWRVVAVSAVLVAAIGLMRAAKGAEHPAATSPNPPGWRLFRALPGEDFRPRGPFSDARTSCQLDMASESFVVPSGTRLVCLKVERDGSVRR